MKSGEINSLFKNLSKVIKNPKSDLAYKNKFTLLVSVVLSAQCTDVNVNNVTKNLYKKYNKPEHFVKLGRKRIEVLIKKINFFRNKAKSVYLLSKQLIERHNSKVPKDFEKLIALPGVGRKTASVVLNEGFGLPTIAVDTHVFRVSNRTGLAYGKNPDEVQQNLYKVVPKKYLKKAGHTILLHGRYTCKARKPLCKICVIRKYCKFKNKELN
ncbi:MAG: endonuclease III [Pelagibacteraceae bacterium]|nr:endonuclease III [Pelagibacteraceae bacterium]MBO6483308.1 endonuclease III [Pelagibacteraceae bacterium]